MRSELTFQHLELQRNILRELGHTLALGARVLDFGCGAGSNGLKNVARRVMTLLVAIFASRMNPSACEPSTKRRVRCLFPDATFDFVFSDQVFGARAGSRAGVCRDRACNEARRH